MKKFDRSIQFEIEVDVIVEMFLANLNPEFKHRELFVEVLVERALVNDTKLLGMLMSASLGVDKTINHNIGDIVLCERIVSEFSQEENTYKRVDKKCKIVQISKYSDTPLQVEFDVKRKEGTIYKEKEWIALERALKIPINSEK